MRVPLFRQICSVLVFTMSLLAVIPRVEAGMVGSELIGLSPSERQVNLEKLKRFLESEVVGKRLQALGFTAEEVSGRLESLTDEELHQFATRVDQLRVAGDGALGVVVVLLVIAILVVIFLQLTGHRIVVVED